jgi:hypothetical protein
VQPVYSAKLGFTGLFLDPLQFCLQLSNLLTQSSCL